LHRLGYDGDNMIARIEAVFDPRIIGEGDGPVTVGDADDVSRIAAETRLNEPVGNIGTDALAIGDTPFTDKSRADNPVFFPLRTVFPIDRDVVPRMVAVEILVVRYLPEPQIRDDAVVVRDRQRNQALGLRRGRRSKRCGDAEGGEAHCCLTHGFSPWDTTCF